MPAEIATICVSKKLPKGGTLSGSFFVIFSPLAYAVGTSGSKGGMEETPGSGVTGGSGVMGGRGSKLTTGSEDTGGSWLLGSSLLTPELTSGVLEGSGLTLGDTLGDADGDALGLADGEADGDGETALPAIWSEPPLQVRGMLSGEYQPTAVS